MSQSSAELTTASQASSADVCHSRSMPTPDSEAIIHGAEMERLSALQEELDQDEVFQMAQDLLNFQSLGLLKKWGVPRPRFIVCGRPDAMNSLLANMSRVRLPNVSTDDGPDYVRRFSLSRRPPHGMLVTIRPGPSRTSDEHIQQLQNFRYEAHISSQSLSDAIQQAHALLRSITTSRISDDILQIDLRGPKATGVTLLDIPGFRNEPARDNSTEEDTAILAWMSKHYVRETDWFLIAIPAARIADRENAINIAKKFDPTSTRTLSVLTFWEVTHPQLDLAAHQSQLNHNERGIPGPWHVLYEPTDLSPESPHRDRLEANFFYRAPWSELEKGCVGMPQLALRLQTIAHRKCNAYFLSRFLGDVERITAEVDTATQDIQQQLGVLGEERTSSQQRRGYLLKICSRFQSIVDQALNGVYMDNFFFAQTEAGSNDKIQKLRDIVLDLNEFFFQAMLIRGSRQCIAGLTSFDSVGVPRSNPYIGTWNPTWVSLHSVETEVESQIQRNHNNGASDFIDQQLVNTLFHNQSLPWETLARHHLVTSYQSVRYFIAQLLSYLSDEETSKTLMDKIFEPKLEAIKNCLVEKLAELASSLRRTRLLPASTSLVRGDGRNLNAITAQFESSRNIPSRAGHIVRRMQAYYDTAIITFMDNVVTLGIENLLLAPLADIFPCQLINEMSDQEVELLASEPQFLINKRIRLHNELKMYQLASESIGRLTRPFLNPNFMVSMPSTTEPLSSASTDSASAPPVTYALDSSNYENQQAQGHITLQPDKRIARAGNLAVPCSMGFNSDARWVETLQGGQSFWETITALPGWRSFSLEEIRLNDYVWAGLI